jgi:hypothetical protein
VPETLNRPLPNSIEDVLKWPRHLTTDEKELIKETYKLDFKWLKRLKNCFTRNHASIKIVEFSNHKTSDKTQNDICVSNNNLRKKNTL